MMLMVHLQKVRIMMAKNKTELINRKEYDRIRKMDHGQMSMFCRDMYLKGYNAGKQEASGLSESEVQQVILQIKGIGEKKANDIVKALTQAQEERRRVVK